jgi:hypothetical protein
MSVRFSPDACPGCGEPLQPRYSTYRTGTRGPLFPLGLVAGVVGTLALLGLSFWGAAVIAGAVFGNAGLTRRELGVLTFLVHLPLLALLVAAVRAGWIALHRLPKTFHTGCETCTWTGPCKVYERSEG